MYYLDVLTVQCYRTAKLQNEYHGPGKVIIWNGMSICEVEKTLTYTVSGEYLDNGSGCYFLMGYKEKGNKMSS